MDLHAERDTMSWPPYRKWNYYYNKEGLKEYETKHSIDINEDPQIIELIDSTLYRYKNRLEIDNKRFLVHPLYKEEGLKLIRDFGEHTRTYKLDKDNNIIKMEEKDGDKIEYEYKDGYLYKKEVKNKEGTDTYYYYPNGVTKEAKLSTLLLLNGHFTFSETGDLLTFNGEKYAEYSEYDTYGNWTKRIIYKDNGDPHTYTERKIEYYE